MKLTVIFGLLLVATLASASTCPNQPDYYWREYTGDVPEDAVEATIDKLGRKTYIGHAYIVGGGLIVGQLYPGDKRITLVRAPAVFQDVYKFIQILCSRNRTALQWFKVNESSPHSVPHHLVEGGYEGPGAGVLYIGRANYKGNVFVGKVHGYRLDASMYFPYYDYNDKKYKEISMPSYEVLVYKDADDIQYQNWTTGGVEYPYQK